MWLLDFLQIILEYTEKKEGKESRITEYKNRKEREKEYAIDNFL